MYPSPSQQYIASLHLLESCHYALTPVAFPPTRLLPGAGAWRGWTDCETDADTGFSGIRTGQKATQARGRPGHTNCPLRSSVPPPGRAARCSCPHAFPLSAHRMAFPLDWTALTMREGRRHHVSCFCLRTGFPLARGCFQHPGANSPSSPVKSHFQAGAAVTALPPQDAVSWVPERRQAAEGVRLEKVFRRRGCGARGGGGVLPSCSCDVTTVSVLPPCR